MTKKDSTTKTIMAIGYSKKFKKQYKKLSKNIQIKFYNRLTIFMENQGSEQLQIHKLHGKFQNLKSINITGDIHAVFEEISPSKIAFIAIGSHSELYS